MAEKKCLSLCMVTHNCEKYLSGCLSDMSRIADEIIIADIGSTDRTCELAFKAGAHVIKVNWDMNFSKAKNICLEHAEGDWIFFLQPNETIPPEHMGEIKPLLDNPNAEGYLFYVDPGIENYRITSPSQALRLFRNRKEYRYKYRVFEHIPDEVLSNVKDSDIRIFRQADSDIPCSISTLDLLDEELAEHPDDSYLLYIYGIELINQNRHEESIPYLRTACGNVNLDFLYAPHLFKCLSWSYIAMQRQEDALIFLNDGIKYFPYYTDLLVLRGEIHRQNRRFIDAIRDLESCLKINEQAHDAVPRPEINSSVILEILGDVHQEAANYHQALACYRRAYEFNKRNSQILKKIGKVAEKSGLSKFPEDLLEEVMEDANSEKLLILMDALFQLGQYSRVLSCIDCNEGFLEKEQTDSIKCACYIMMDDGEKAALYSSSIDRQSPNYPQILLLQIENDWAHNRFLEADRLLVGLDQTERLDGHIKELYRNLNNLLVKNESSFAQPFSGGYEALTAIIRTLLRFDQTDKARLILPLLLQEEATEEIDTFIETARLFAERNEIDAAVSVFRAVPAGEKRINCIIQVIDILLRSDHTEAARKLSKLVDSHDLGPLDYIIRARHFINRIKKYIERIEEEYGHIEISSNTINEGQNRPERALVALYQALCLSRNQDDIDYHAYEEKTTCALIHYEIGIIYEKANKKREALCACLRSLMWDPLDDALQNRIYGLLMETQICLEDLLKEQNIEGGWFGSNKEFLDFVHGFICFKKHDFSQAQVLFSRIEPDAAVFPVALAYSAITSIIEGKEDEAVSYLPEKIELFFTASIKVCKTYFTDLLNEGCRQYPYSEFLMMEKQFDVKSHLQGLLCKKKDIAL